MSERFIIKVDFVVRFKELNQGDFFVTHETKWNPRMKTKQYFDRQGGQSHNSIDLNGNGAIIPDNEEVIKLEVESPMVFKKVR